MAKKEVKLISVTMEQYTRLKAIADTERRTMRAVLDIMMDSYTNKKDEKDG